MADYSNDNQTKYISLENLQRFKTDLDRHIGKSLTFATLQDIDMMFGALPATMDFTYTLENCYLSYAPAVVDTHSSFYCEIYPYEGCGINMVIVTNMYTGEAVTDSVYDPILHTISIPDVTYPVSFYVSASYLPEEYGIEKQYVHVYDSNAQAYVTQGSAYSNTIVAAAGYEEYYFEFKMGSEDLWTSGYVSYDDYSGEFHIYIPYVNAPLYLRMYAKDEYAQTVEVYTDLEGCWLSNGLGYGVVGDPYHTQVYFNDTRHDFSMLYIGMVDGSGIEQDVTEYFDMASNTISIPNITGRIAIVIHASAPSSYNVDYSNVGSDIYMTNTDTTTAAHSMYENTLYSDYYFTWHTSCNGSWSSGQSEYVNKRYEATIIYTDVDGDIEIGANIK